MPHRLPVDAGRLHRDMGTALASQPVRQREQLLGCRLEAAHLAPYRTVHHVPNAGHDRILVHVETGAMWVQNLHIPSCRCASRVGSRQTNSRERAPEPSPARGAIGGAPESWVQLTDGLLAPSKTRPLCRGRCPGYYQLRPVSSMAGRRSRWVTNRDPILLTAFVVVLKPQPWDQPTSRHSAPVPVKGRRSMLGKRAERERCGGEIAQ